MIVCYLRDGDRVFETYWATGRATEAMGSVYGLLDMTIYGRQGTFEDSPPGWPQFWRSTGEQWRINGAPLRNGSGSSRPPPRPTSASAPCDVPVSYLDPAGLDGVDHAALVAR